LESAPNRFRISTPEYSALALFCRAETAAELSDNDRLITKTFRYQRRFIPEPVVTKTSDSGAGSRVLITFNSARAVVRDAAARAAAIRIPLAIVGPDNVTSIAAL